MSEKKDPAAPEIDELARRMWVAYCQQAGGSIIPDWQNMFDDHRGCWRAAAAEAVRSGKFFGFHLVADIRWACGDKGRRMQPELIEYIGSLYQLMLERPACNAGLEQAYAEWTARVALAMQPPGKEVACAKDG